MSVFPKELYVIRRVRVTNAGTTQILNRNGKMHVESYLKEILMLFPTNSKWSGVRSHLNWRTRGDATAKRPTVSRNIANVFTQESNARTFVSVKTV